MPHEPTFTATTPEGQALEVCAAAIVLAEELGLAEDAVAVTLLGPAGVLVRTLADVRVEYVALSMRHLDFPADMDPR